MCDTTQELKDIVMKKWLPFGAGLGLGLVFGLGMLLGVSINQQPQVELTLPPQALHASATHGSSNFAIATGEIADGVEGVFFLDFLTGELQCHVPNARNPQAPGGLFKHNVVADLGIERGKKPQYLMVTGRVAFRGGGQLRPADCMVYVVDGNTGNFAAYILPWNRQASVVGAAQANPMTLLTKGRARSVEIVE